MLCGWKGNRRSNISLAGRDRLQWSNHLRTGSQRKSDDTRLRYAVCIWRPYLYLYLAFVRPENNELASRCSKCTQHPSVIDV